MKILKEWNAPVPWGNLAMVSFGNESGEPVLMIHGRQDSMATFFLLLEHLPDTYHYVAVDMPGNGKSDAFPHGVKIQRFHFMGAMELAVQHLGWKTFIFIGHSMGCEQGLFYNAVYPNVISRLILLDAGPTLQRLQVTDLAEYQSMFFDDYYSNYDRDNYHFKVYTKEKAISSMMRARGLNREQAEVVLSRNLIPVDDGRYRLSWDNRLKSATAQNYPKEYYFSLFKSIPFTLLIAASEGNRGVTKGKEAADWIISRMDEELEQFCIVKLDGSHDVHITHPELVASHIKTFLEKSVGGKAKL